MNFGDALRGRQTAGPVPFGNQQGSMEQQNQQQLQQSQQQQAAMLRFQQQMDMLNLKFKTLSTIEESKHKAITEMLQAIK